MQIEQVKADEVEWPCIPRGQRPLTWAMTDPQAKEYVSPELAAVALRMYSEGSSYTQIGREIGVTRWVAKRVIEDSTKEAA